MEKNAKGGFTLIELMVVVIIIAILAGIAIPSFNKSMENARAGEAKTTLELIYNAQKIYRIDKGTYAADWNSMDKYIEDPNLTAQYYKYDITSATQTAFTATATRKNDATKIFTIDQTGKITP